MLRPCLASNLYQFRAGTGEDRCGLDHVAAERLRSAVDRNREAAYRADREDGRPIREVVPNAKLAYNNLLPFNWTLNFRWQVYDAMKEVGKDVSKYNRADLMKPEYDDTPLGISLTSASVPSRRIRPSAPASSTI